MKKLFFSALVFAALTSCSDENLVVQDPMEFSEVEVTFATTVQSRVTGGTTWEADDQIGIYMVQSGSDVTANTLFTYADSQFTSETSLYYPNSGDKVSFYAYYPYYDSTSKLRDIDITEQIPFLEAVTTASYDKEVTEAVALSFKHRLAQINFIIKGGGGNESYTTAESLNITSVKVTGLTTQAQYSLSTGGYIAKSFVYDENASTTLTADGEYVYSMYVLPTIDGTSTELYSMAGTTITIVSDAIGEFEAVMDDTYTIESNKVRECTILLNNTAIDGVGGQIAEWEYADVDVSLDLEY